ncbi:MAG: Mrp/NBP35 family ATP-binding protein [Acidobacteria bacterium]|nr:Mrp/NBP35 family ATP-binding protein [Acidobacteriota bacterium]MCG3194065.1 Iron-sulfur cluster carrier protein [Thermoanaerobaculia bacterium]MCK6682710.1 Mrp/NBP35 family ATP-binding protein [Thermoanaerobaculia bacterium]
MSQTTLTQETALEALKKVKYPGLSRDIVSFGFVQDLNVGGGNVSFRLSLTSGTPGVAEQLQAECEAALRALPGVSSVTIKVEVKGPQPVTAAAPPQKDLLNGTRFIVAVASGKGGVGKSTVAANLALSLTRLGYRVGLMDSDIYGPSQQMMMGIQEKPFLNEDEKIMPIARFGVNVMSIGFLMDVDTPVIWRGPMVYKAVEQLLGDVAWGQQDFLIVDLPPGTGDAQLTLTQKVQLSGAVIVTTPQDVALIDARKGLAMFRQVNVPVLGIIENMSFYECPKCHHKEHIFKSGGGQKTADLLGVPFLGGIPIDPQVALSGDAGMPIVAANPSSVVTEAFMNLARGVAKTVGA